MIRLEINGKGQNVDLPGEMPLLWALRDELGLTLHTRRWNRLLRPHAS
jgi:aerobic-type carbon monoxide dehydrogenase small subunit (CoxS/CutS family)